MTHSADLGFAKMRSTFNYSWKSRAYSGLSVPFSESPEGDLPSFGIANGSVRFEDVAGMGACVSGSVANLFNTRRMQSNLSLQASLGFTTAYYAAPRMWTIEVGMRF